MKTCSFVIQYYDQILKTLELLKKCDISSQLLVMMIDPTSKAEFFYVQTALKNVEMLLTLVQARYVDRSFHEPRTGYFALNFGALVVIGK